MTNTRPNPLRILLLCSTGLLSLSFLTLWILSYYRSDGLIRQWRIRSARAEAADPRTDYLDDAAGWWELRSDCGLLMFSHMHYLATYSSASGNFSDLLHPLTVQWVHQHHAPRTPSRPVGYDRHSFLGLSFFQLDDRGFPQSNYEAIVLNGGGTHTTCPYWLLLLLTAIPPFIAVFRHLRHRSRQREGLCPTCHYDLRAHRPGDKCPECGTLIPPPNTATIPSESRSTK